LSGSDAIDVLRKPWARFQLSRFATLSARQESLLKGQIANPQLGSKERARLLSLFDVSLLNAVARENNASEGSLYELLRAMAVLPLLESVRARLWAATVQGLPRDQFLRELYDLARHVREAKIEVSVLNDWAQSVIGLVEHRVNASKDDLLSDLLEDCRGHAQPIRMLSDWIAEHLTFDDLRKSAAEKKDVTPEIQTIPTAKDTMGIPTESTVTKAATSTVNTYEVDLQGWVLELQGTDITQVYGTINKIQSELNQALSTVEACEDLAKLEALPGTLQHIKSEIDGWIARLPDPLRLISDLEHATSAYQQARELVGSEVDELLSSVRLSPSDLVEASNLVQRADVLRRLPDWVWTDGDTPIEQLEIPQMFSRLTMPQIRDRVISILSCLGELGTFESPLLALLPPPPPTEDTDPGTATIDQHVRSWISSMREFLEDLPSELVSELSELQSSGNKRISETRLRQAVGVARRLRDRISKPVMGSIIAIVIAQETDTRCVELAEMFVESVEACEQFFGTALDTTFMQLQARVEKAAAKSTTPFLSTMSALDVRVDHNWVDAQGGKVPLLFRANTDQKERPYGYVSVPLVLTVSQKKAYCFNFEYDVKTGHREGWPRNSEDIEPADLTVSEDAWRDDPEQPDQYLHTLNVKIPLRRQGRGKRFEFHLTTKDAESGRQCGRPAKFSWDVMNDSPVNPVIPMWPEIVDPANVEKHPIGPQKRGRDILARLNQSGSFSVIAPRRFGKSTLVQFLQRKAQEAGFVVRDPVVCTGYYQGP
jgi:hypothetical protein